MNTVRSRTRSRCAHRLLGLAALAALLGAAREAPAKGPTPRLPVEIEVDPCTGVPPEVVARVVTVELGVTVTTAAPGAASEPSQKPDTTLVALSCEEGTVDITVRDPLSGKTLERHVDLRAERSAARPRLLSLSVAELVAASWIELSTTPRPAAPIVEATALPPVRAEAAAVAAAASARHQPNAWDVDAVVIGRRFATTGLTTWGGGIAGAWAYQGWFGLAGDLTAEAGSANIWHDGWSIGKASLTAGSIRLSARLRRSWQSFAIEGGLGARAALTHLRGSAQDAPAGSWVDQSFTDWWGGPLGEVRFAWRPARGTLVVASLEGGAVTRPLAALVAKEPEPVITGSWAALSLGIGLEANPPPFAR